MLISKRIIIDEKTRGFKEQGMYSKQLRHFDNGIVIGSKAFVLTYLKKLKKSGQYKRRKKSIEKLGGIHHCLREQRKN